VQRVVQRTHVRVHFFLQRAGQKAEALAGLDGGARKDDAVHLFREQGGHGHGDGEIRLACAAGADGEDHVVGFEGFHVAFLVRALRSDGLLAERARVRERKCATNGGSGFTRGTRGNAQEGFHFRTVGNSPVADALIVFAQDLRGALHLRLRAFDFQVVIAQMRSNVKGGLEEFKIFVEGSEEFVNATCQPDGMFHSVSRERSLLDTTLSLELA